MSCDLITLSITQGKSWEDDFQFLVDTVTFKPIVAVTQAAPCVLNVPSHGLQAGWIFTIEGCLGMEEINSPKPIAAVVVDADHIQLNGVNALTYPAYTGGGVIRYQVPVDLSSFTTASLEIRKLITDVSPYITLTYANGKLTYDAPSRTVRAALLPADTSGLSSFTGEGVFALNMIAGATIPYWADGVVEFLQDKSP